MPNCVLGAGGTTVVMVPALMEPVSRDEKQTKKNIMISL